MKPVTYLFGAVVLIGLGAWLGYVIRGNEAPATSVKDWWDIATAIGTTGAVIVALGIALFQETRARREALVRAELFAARILEPVRTLRDHARMAQTALENCPDPAGLGYGFLQSGIFTFLRSDILDISTESLALLAPIRSGEVAMRLSLGLGRIDSVAHEVNRFLKNPVEWNCMDAGDRAKQVNEWALDLKVAVDFLVWVLSTCHAALGTTRTLPPFVQLAIEQANAANRERRKRKRKSQSSDEGSKQNGPPTDDAPAH